MKPIDVQSVSSRREFCQHACQAAGLAALGIMLPGCGGGSNPAGPSDMAAALPVVTTSISGGVFMLSIDAASPLTSVGSAALINASGRGFLVARTAQDSFVALTAICTHQNCTINGFQNGQYICPCHGSHYTTSGSVVSGPAPRALQTFPTSFSNGTLTVTTG